MTDEYLNKEIQKAIDLRKNNETSESLKILNDLLKVELKNDDKAYLYFEISMCHYSCKDIVSALVYIEKAIKITPEEYELHFWKGIYYSRIHDFFSYSNCLFKAISLSENQSFIENCYIDILKAADTYFDNFNPHIMEDYLYLKHINCFHQLSKIEIVPEEIREKYLNYRNECIFNLKEKIESEFTYGAGDEFYKKKLELIRQFLKIEEINQDEKLIIIKKYAEAKSVLRYYYGYKLEENFNNVTQLNNTGDIILENGEIVTNCNTLDLVTGVILHTEDRIIVVDAYEREREAPMKSFHKGYNGWHITDAKELELILNHRKDLDEALDLISGSKKISDTPRYIKNLTF